MKKLICILLSLIFLAGIFCAGAEEALPEKNFAQALMEWAEGLDLEKSDYKAALTLPEGQSYEAVLRQDGGITELAVADFGRLQVSDRYIGVEYDGTETRIDITLLTELLGELKEGRQPFSKDLELIQPWLQKAYLELVLPCVSISGNSAGTVVHIEVTDEKIRDGLTRLIDEFIAERTTAEALLERWGKYLGMLIPGLPGSVEELEKAWQEEKEHPSFDWPDFSLTADITVRSSPWGSTSFTCTGALYIGEVCDCGFSAEAVSGSSGFDLTASVVLSGDDYSYDSGVTELEIHTGGGRFSAKLSSGETVYTLDGSAAEEGRKTRVEATLRGESSGRELMRYDLEAVADGETQTIDAALYECRTSRNYSSETLRNLLASLKVRRRDTGLDAELKFAGGSGISLNLSADSLYRRMKLEVTERYSTQVYFDLWLYPSGVDGFRAALYLQVPDSEMYVCSLEAGRNRFAFDVSSAGRKGCSLTAVYTPAPDGFSAEIEYMNILSPDPKYNTGETPARLTVTREGNRLSADLEARAGGAPALSATAELDLAPNGMPERLEIKAVPYGPNGPDILAGWRILAVPGTLTYTDRTGEYVLAVAEDTAERWTLTLTKNGEEELMRLTFALEGGALRGVLTVSGQETATLAVEPAEKEPITEITGESPE